MSILIQYSMYLYIFLFTKPLKSSTLAADFKKNEKHINSIYHETTFSKYCYRIYLHTDRSGTKSLFQLIRQMEFPDRPGRYRRQGTMVQKIPRRFYQPARLHALKTERR